MSNSIGVRVAAVLAIHDQVIVIERKNSQLTLPGGNVENDETIEQAIVREIKEETGLTIASFAPLFLQDMLIHRAGVDGLYRKTHMVFYAAISDSDLHLLRTNETDDLLGDGVIRLINYKQLATAHLYPAVGEYIAELTDLSSPGTFRIVPPMTDGNFMWK